MSSRTYRESFEEYLQLKSQEGASTTPGNVILSYNFDQVIPDASSIRSPNSQISASLPSNFRDALSKQYHPSESRVGVVAKLPQEYQLQNSGSIVLSQPHVNSGAYGHPCLTLGLSKCGRFVFCAQMTSFGGSDLRDKYYNAHPATLDRVLWEYLALDYLGKSSHNSMPTLQHDGKVMEKLTYAHLDHGFWIEWECLGSFKGGNRRLTPDSLNTAREAYALAESQRQRYGATSKFQVLPTMNEPLPINHCQGQRSLSGSSTGSSSSSTSSCNASPVLGPALPYGHHRQQQYHNSQYTNFAPLQTWRQAPVFNTQPVLRPAAKPFNPMAASWRPVPQQA